MGLYGRVSKLAQASSSRQDQLARGEGRSVDQQLAELQRIADREAVTVVGVYRDDGISASRFAKSGKVREGWLDVMAAITAGRITELWVWEISRTTRDRPVWATLINVCIAQRVLISVNGRLHDPNEPDDAFMLDLGAMLAVRESATSSKRILRDVAARAAAGKVHGKLAYGYAREYDSRTGALVRQYPCPQTGPVVEELAQRVLAGESLYSIAADLDRRGVLSPESFRARRVGDEQAAKVRWRSETIRHLLRSPTIAGQRVHLGKIVAVAEWEPLISAADHNALRALFDRPRRDFQPGVIKHLLSGIATCGVCGTPLRRLRNRATPSYVCPGPERRGNSCVARVQDKLDALVTLHVVTLLSGPAFLTELAQDSDRATSAVSDASRKVEELEAELQSFITAAQEGRISATSFAAIEPSLQERLVLARDKAAASAGYSPLVRGLVGADVERGWEALDIDRQRQVIRSLVVVRVHRSSFPRGSTRFDPSTVEITRR